MSNRFASSLAIVRTILTLASLSGVAAAQISFVQANTGPSTVQSSNITVGVTFPSVQTAGDLNIVVIGWRDTTSSIAWVFDSQGNTYQRAAGPTSGTGVQQAIYYAKNIAGGNNAVAVTFHQAAAFPDLRIFEYRGVDPNNPLDITAAAVGTGTSANSGSATSTSANELIFGAGTTAAGAFSTAGSGFTRRVLNVYGNIAEDKTVTSSGSYSATATKSSGNWVMQMATFSASPLSRIRMHEVASPVVGYRYATRTQGQGLTTSVVNSVAGPTSGVQVTKTAGGPQMVWISPPLATAVTISGAVMMNTWAKESATTCNCGMQVKLHKYSGGSEGAAFLNSERGTELGTTAARQNWTATPTSTSFSAGDRIVVKWWINDAGGNMASGKTVTTDYDGNSPAIDGDTWVQFTEALSFQSEPEIIQNKSASNNGQSSIDVDLNPTGAGNLFAVVVTADPPSTMVTSMDDNAPLGSCHYVEANALSVNSVTGGGFSDIWYCPRSNPGAFYLPLTVSPATSGKLSIWVYEISGLDPTSPLDASGIASDPNNHSTYTGPSLNTSAVTDFLVEATEGSCGSPSSVSAPWTLDAHPGNDASAYLTASGTFQPTFTFTCAGSAVMSGAAFRPALPNQPPVTSAGPNQTISLPTNSVTLSGSASDDGLPNGTLSITWTKVSGPGTVTFSNPNAAVTQATFPSAGTYVLQLTANDSQLSSSSTTTITVNPANQPPVVNAGQNQTITFPQDAVALNGTATDDGLPVGSVLKISWSSVSGPVAAQFVNASSLTTNAFFAAPGIYVLSLSANDSQYTTTSNVTITVNPPTGTPASASIVLSPTSAGPISVGTAQQIQASVRDGSGAAISNATVTFTVTGANAASSQVVTNSSGIATFSYTGTLAGVDSVVGTSTLGSLALVSNPSMISWAVAAPQITSSSVAGQFFTSDGSGTFDTLSSAQPVFTQTFSSINFNPPAGTVPGAPASIDVTTRPFTGVVTDANGNFSSSVIAQGNGFQAGAGQLAAFQAVFTGTLTVAAAGNVTFKFFNADGFVFGIGNSASRISGTYVEAPTATAFHGYPVMGAFNNVTAPVANTVTVHFPAAGSYPYEVDYAASSQLPLISPGTGWRYSLSNPPGFQLLGFDDSGFSTGAAPFTDVVGAASTFCPLIGSTYFPAFGILDVRKIISLPAGASNISASVAIDNDFTLWVNGTLVTNQSHEGCSSEWNYTVPIPDNLWLPGDNLIAVQARDRGNVTGLEFQLTAPSSSLPSLTKQLSLTMRTVPTVGQGGVTVSPGGTLAHTVGQGIAFTALVTDASGALLPNVPVTFNVAGANPQQFQAMTDSTGTAAFTDHGFLAGTDIVQAQAQLVGNVSLISNQTTVTWSYLSNPPPTGSMTISPTNPASLNTGQTETFTVQAFDALGSPAPNIPVTLLVSLANTLQLTATTNSTGTATFSYVGINPGVDTVQAEAIVGNNLEFTSIVSLTWTIPGGGSGGGSGSCHCVVPGWIGWPTNGTIVQGQVPITVTSIVSLSSGTLTYWPTSNPGAVTTLNSSTTGNGTIGTLDTTTLPSGPYTIQLSATANGTTQISQVTVSVAGQNKPGRMTSTVTEFKVPLAGIPISITRTYDSLERSLNEDFGFGWKLGTTVGLTVDSMMNVSFNFNGQRQTFYFAPQPSSSFSPWLQVPQYVPQPGLHGTLISDGCPSVLNVQGTWHCFSPGLYQPTVYVYTDPIGRTYTISASGQLQSIKDLNGNLLTVTANGITSSAGSVVVPFVRDGQNRITKITDLNGKNYIYSYDTSGNLQSVSYPGLTALETYTYFADHSLQAETDPRGNTSSATYYADGRLQSLSDTMVPPNVWQYAYSLNTNTTTITNPDGGIVVRTDDSFGNPLSITDPLNRTTTYQYDANENLLTMVDPLQTATVYTYDPNGFQTSVQDPLGHISHKTYNQFGGVTSATDAANSNTVTTSYNASFNPSQVTDLLNGPGTQVSSSTYDSQGDLKTYTDANQKTTTFDYFGTGFLMDAIDALQEETSYTYDSMGRVATVTDPRANRTQYFYDQLGRLSTVIDAASVTTNYLYDNNGNKTDEIDAVGTTLQRTTHYDYDNMNRVKLITYPTSPATTLQFTYDFRGNKLTETDQSGRVTKYVYDLAGQLSTVTYAFGTADAGTMTYTYDLDGRKKTVKDELNNLTTNNYDAAGRLTSVQDATANPATVYGYDADNRKTSVQDPNGNTTSYAYFARSWLQTITYPAAPPNPSTTMQYTYDGMGRVKTTTDQAGKVTTKAYDDVGRLSSVTDALLPTGNTTHYTYDLAGNLKTIQDANNHTTTFQYDSLNRRMSRTLPLQQIETTTYDAVGNLSTKTDFNGKTTTYHYDPVNRLTQKIPDASLSQPTISFTYTPSGQRASMTDASGTTSYTSYDNRDRLLSKATPEGTLSYTYDAHGNLLTITSSNTNGASMTYTYDVLNRLASAKDNRVAAQGGPSAPTTYSYDPAGNLTGYAYPNALQTGNVFDTLNRLTQTCTAASAPACSAGTKLASYAYTLGNAGNRTAVVELGGRGVGYGYDNDYRLTSEAITGDPGGKNGTVSYTSYDAAGNRLQMTSTLNAVPGGSFSYDANDRLAIDTFDANGNTTSSAGISNTYDFENRMLTHGAMSIVYDGDGNRVSETAGGVTTKYLVDTLNPTHLPQVLDEIVNGSVTRTYAYGLQRISEDQQISGAWTPSFYGYDGHGNVRLLVNASGTVTDTYDYDAFGMSIKINGTTPNPYFYSGERLDSGTGLYDLRARYYNQATGRFWARDPVEGKKCCGLSWNPYIYVRQNPVNWTDPSGRALEDYIGLTFEDIVQLYAEVKNIARANAEAFCFDAAAVYAVQYPDATIEEILWAEALCLSKLGF